MHGGLQTGHSPDRAVVQVIEQADGVLEEGRAALPQALCLLCVHIQQVYKGSVALWRSPRSCTNEVACEYMLPV